MNRGLLEEARAALASGPLPLSKLHARLHNAGSAWSESQHCLFFLAFDGFSVEQSGDRITVSAGKASREDRLLAEIVKVVESLGKPASAQEIKSHLPSDCVTTEQQIKAIAKRSDRLEVFGPGWIRGK